MEKPKVVVALSGLTAFNQSDCRISVKPTAISKNGFTLNYETWSDTKIHTVAASWFAYNEKLEKDRRMACCSLLAARIESGVEAFRNKDKGYKLDSDKEGDRDVVRKVGAFTQFL